ncbi:DnaJ C-terminal domain-containing protein [Labrys wisconsinensis]|uniref:DnaJ-class molecular chaperone n=1 Tax=Labrys wisconsinensis TaxID=425677 RepID=A0ABU0JC67_9HYPH|nr:DnaJ C-terminal domain-containing protein [Labrys wisconsinensis]MDQ0470732.1 DnaJ-class molecular chaperone [Labrys wisconsinensis]
MRDPYTVLGVSKSAGATDIKKAFRKLAKQYHPDQNSDPKAAAKFAEVNSAYEILGDEKKRAQFDRGEIDAEGKPRFHGFEGFGAGGPGGAGQDTRFEFNFGGGRGRRGGGFEDILSEMFGGGGRAGTREAAPRGADVQATVRAPFTTWALGGKVRIDLPGGSVDVTVPAGIAEGKTIRLKGQGEPSPFRGESGDALVTVTVEPHPQFRADGRNVRVDVNVTLYEAALGGKVRVPTLDGSVDLTLPPGTSGARTFRLKGKGIQAKDGPGDLLVTPRVVLPERIDPDLAAALKRLRDERPYDPGRS